MNCLDNKINLKTYLFKVAVLRIALIATFALGLFQKLSSGGGANIFLSGGGEGVLLAMCPRGGGVTCPGSQGIFDP